MEIYINPEWIIFSFCYGFEKGNLYQSDTLPQ